MHTFEAIFKKGQVLIPYITFADPKKEATESLILDCFAAGADIVELGIPFSDPVADGPVIQSSHSRVLASQPDISVSDVFACVKSVRKKIDKPIILMTTVNHLINHGVTRFFKEAAKSSVSGVVIPDLSIEDAGEYRAAAKAAKVPIVFLVSPTCSDVRLEKIVKATGGFLYLISSTGTTGERNSFSDNLEKIIRKVKKIRNIPIAVGFGISKPQHARKFWKIADAIIVGSHLVQIFNKNEKTPKKIQSELKAALTVFSKARS